MNDTERLLKDITDAGWGVSIHRNDDGDTQIDIGDGHPGREADFSSSGVPLTAFLMEFAHHHRKSDGTIATKPEVDAVISGTAQFFADAVEQGWKK